MGLCTSLSPMVRLLDVRSGSYAEVRSARRGLLRVCVHVPGTAGVMGITWLRVPLVADLLFRAAELHDMQVLTVVAFAGQSAFVYADRILGLDLPRDIGRTSR
jgi:hypothetical protein